MKRACALLILLITPSAFAQLYVKNDWTLQSNTQIAVASEAEYRDFWFRIDSNQYISLANDFYGPVNRSSSASGWGKVTDNNAISEMVGTLRAGCYYSDANATARRNNIDETQGARTTEYCVENACEDVNQNGICDSRESSGFDPNEDSCPGNPACASPIVINLAHGPERLSGADDPVAFDIDADGRANVITWTARGSAMAFLAIDRNRNSSIDDGSELFGNWTPLRSGLRAANGFEALRELDSNGDGRVNALDAGWSALLLWTDANHDGVSQANELHAVTASAVQELETGYHWTGRRDASGNLFAYQGAAHFGAARRSIYDVYFQRLP